MESIQRGWPSSELPHSFKSASELRGTVLSSVTHFPSDPEWSIKSVMHINQLGARLPACLHCIYNFFNAPNEAVQAVAVLKLQWEPNGGGGRGACCGGE